MPSVVIRLVDSRTVMTAQVSDMEVNQGQLTIYTDGACSGNPGPGGWGAVLLWKDQKLELSGGEVRTTNNRMEMTGAIKALQTLKGSRDVTLYSDSEYLRNGITNWIRNWKRNNWQRSKSGSVKNVDLWRELDQLNSLHRVTWKWVKGHSGNEWNDRADELARQAIPVRKMKS